MKLELKDCKRCSTPFDPSWSGTPDQEEYCSSFCKIIDAIEERGYLVCPHCGTKIDDIR